MVKKNSSLTLNARSSPALGSPPPDTPVACPVSAANPPQDRVQQEYQEENEDEGTPTATQEERSNPASNAAKRAWRPLTSEVDWHPISEENALSLLVRAIDIKNIDHSVMNEGVTAWEGWANYV